MLALLLASLIIPLIAAAVLLLLRGSMPAGTPRWVALGTVVVSVVLAGSLYCQYKKLPAVENGAPVQPGFESVHHWFTTGGDGTPEQPGFEVNLHLGVDGVSVAMILLTAILGFSCVLYSWNSTRAGQAEYYAAMLAMQAAVVGVFSAFDVVLFYAFFEMTLIPLFFLIIIWGGEDRKTAAYRFFLYTFAASVITLVGVVGLVLHAASAGVTNPTSMSALSAYLTENPMDARLQAGLFLAIACGFLVKVPVFPFHTWLPITYVQSPTAGTVFASGLLAKLGVYGFLRLCLPMFPDACLNVGLPLIGVLSCVGIIYASLVALVQTDIKRLVAFSSIAHLGFCTLGLFALNTAGIAGGVLQMVNHGLSTAGLFLLVGMIAERYQSRDLRELGGVATRLPCLGFFMVLMAMASIGLPGLNGFAGEFLSLIGMFERHPLYAILGATGVILGAWYLLTMLQQVMFGPERAPRHAPATIKDLRVSELAAIAPLALLCLWIGVYPQSVLKVIEPNVESVAKLYAAANAETEQVQIFVEDAGVQTLVSNDDRGVIRVGN